MTAWEDHLKSPGHKRRQHLVRLQEAIQESERNKHGIIVSETVLDFGLVDVGQMNNVAKKSVIIKTTVPNSCVLLERCQLASQKNANHRIHLSYFPSLSSARRASN